MNTSPAWLHPDIYPVTHPACLEVLQNHTPELVAEGPTRTSKTLTNLQKGISLCFTVPKFRLGILRANATDLDASIRYDLNRTLFRYALDDPRSPIRLEGGAKFHTLHFPNTGAECRLGGLNNPRTILGTQYDMIIVSQLEQITEEQFQILKTRCSGSAANWMRKDGMPISQVLCDMNPTVPEEWMYQREKKGVMKFVKVGFKANPYFFRQNCWSKIGYTTVKELDRSLTGIYHQRYFQGLRVAAQGAVYELTDAHFLDEFPDLRDYMVYNACDWGMNSPSVCIWIAHNHTLNDTIVYLDYRRTGSRANIIDFGHSVNRIREQEGREVMAMVTDNDLNRQILLRDHCGIESFPSRKGAGSVMDRVHLIQNALANTVLGRPGGLRFFRGLRHSYDPNPEAKDQTIIDELRGMRYDLNKKEDVVREDDHGENALGYFYLWKESGMRIPSSNPISSGVL